MSEPAGAAPGDGPDLLEEVERLIAELESHPEESVRERVRDLLSAIDTVHRTALTKLVDAIRSMAGEAFINRLIADPGIRLLLMSYDLITVSRRVQAEEAVDAVRGHLHARGVDVELIDVVGGVVSVRLHGLGRAPVSPDAVLRDLKAALHAGLLGFQELVVRDGAAPASVANLVQVTGVRRANRPVYRTALPADELPEGVMKGMELEGQPILVANVGGEVYAVRNRCGESPLPLEFGTLAANELLCPWHGCRYDVRSGMRLDGGSDRLQVYPVAVADGEIRVAIGVEPVAAG